MTPLDRTASRLKRRDEEPNIALARDLADTADRAGLREIVSGLSSGDAALESDCIKVLYETARLKPELVAEHASVFLGLLKRSGPFCWII